MFPFQTRDEVGDEADEVFDDVFVTNVISAEAGGVRVAATAVEASDLVGDGDGGADFAGELAVGVGLDGDGDLDAFDEAEFFEDKDVGVVFVGVLLDVFPGDVDGGDEVVEGVVDALNEVGFVVEDAGGFFHEFAAGFFEIGDVEVAKFQEVGEVAEGVGGGAGGGEAESVGRDGVDEVFGDVLVDFEVLVFGDFVNEVGASGERFNQAGVGESEVVFGFVVVEDEDGFFGEFVSDRGVVEEFREEGGGGGVDDDVAVGFPVEVVFDAGPVGEVAEVFRDVNGAVEGDLFGLVEVRDEVVEGEGGAKGVAVGVFRLNDAKVSFIFQKVEKRVIHI